jgi:hypothetical protein
VNGSRGSTTRGAVVESRCLLLTGRPFEQPILEWRYCRLCKVKRSLIVIRVVLPFRNSYHRGCEVNRPCSSDYICRQSAPVINYPMKATGPRMKVPLHNPSWAFKLHALNY